jgi:hypothetical protein
LSSPCQTIKIIEKTRPKKPPKTPKQKEGHGRRDTPKSGKKEHGGRQAN